MTSIHTNDEQQINNNPEDCSIKEKSNWKNINFESLASVPYADRASVLSSTWQAATVPIASPALLHNLHRITLLYILQEEWSKLDSSKKDDLRAKVERCSAALEATGNDAGSRRLLHLLGISHEPWNHPVLKDIMEGRTPEKSDVEQWCRDEGVAGGLERLRQLCAAGNACTGAALRMARALLVLEHSHGARKTALDTLLVLLFKKGDTRTCISEIKALDSKEVISVIRRLSVKDKTSGRLWKHAHDTAILCAQVTVAACLVKPIQEGELSILCGQLAMLYSNHLDKLISTLRKLIQTAETSVHIYTVCRVIQHQFPDKMRPLVCELYIRALTTGMNELERLKLQDENSEASKASSHTLARWFVNLSDYLTSNKSVSAECVLTAFSLHPSKQYYNLVEKCSEWMCDNADSKGDPVEPEDDKPPDIDVMAASDGISNLDIDGSKISEPKKTFRLFSDGIGVDGKGLAKRLVSGEVLDAESLGLTADACNDLAVLISGPRLKMLTWELSWKALSSHCLSYMEDTAEGTKAITKELKFVKLDYSQFEYHEPEIHDIYFGIEKGYEHHLKLDEEEEEDDEEGYWENQKTQKRYQYDSFESSNCDSESESNWKSNKQKKKSSKNSTEFDLEANKVKKENKKEKKKLDQNTKIKCKVKKKKEKTDKEGNVTKRAINTSIPVNIKIKPCEDLSGVKSVRSFDLSNLEDMKALLNTKMKPKPSVSEAQGSSQKETAAVIKTTPTQEPNFPGKTPKPNVKTPESNLNLTVQKYPSKEKVSNMAPCSSTSSSLSAPVSKSEAPKLSHFRLQMDKYEAYKRQRFEKEFPSMFKSEIKTEPQANVRKELPIAFKIETCVPNQQQFGKECMTAIKTEQKVNERSKEIVWKPLDKPAAISSQEFIGRHAVTVEQKRPSSRKHNKGTSSTPVDLVLNMPKPKGFQQQSYVSAADVDHREKLIARVPPVPQFDCKTSPTHAQNILAPYQAYDKTSNVQEINKSGDQIRNATTPLLVDSSKTVSTKKCQDKKLRFQRLPTYGAFAPYVATSNSVTSPSKSLLQDALDEIKIALASHESSSTVPTNNEQSSMFDSNKFQFQLKSGSEQSNSSFLNTLTDQGTKISRPTKILDFTPTGIMEYEYVSPLTIAPKVLKDVEERRSKLTISHVNTPSKNSTPKHLKKQPVSEQSHSHIADNKVSSNLDINTTNFSSEKSSPSKACKSDRFSCKKADTLPALNIKIANPSGIPAIEKDLKKFKKGDKSVPSQQFDPYDRLKALSDVSIHRVHERKDNNPTSSPGGMYSKTTKALSDVSIHRVHERKDNNPTPSPGGMCSKTTMGDEPKPVVTEVKEKEKPPCAPSVLKNQSPFQTFLNEMQTMVNAGLASKASNVVEQPTGNPYIPKPPPSQKDSCLASPTSQSSSTSRTSKNPIHNDLSKSDLKKESVLQTYARKNYSSQQLKKLSLASASASDVSSPALVCDNSVILRTANSDLTSKSSGKKYTDHTSEAVVKSAGRSPSSSKAISNAAKNSPKKPPQMELLKTPIKISKACLPECVDLSHFLQPNETKAPKVKASKKGSKSSKACLPECGDLSHFLQPNETKAPKVKASKKGSKSSKACLPECGDLSHFLQPNETKAPKVKASKKGSKSSKASSSNRTVKGCDFPSTGTEAVGLKMTPLRYYSNGSKTSPVKSERSQMASSKSINNLSQNPDDLYNDVYSHLDWSVKQSEHTSVNTKTNPHQSHITNPNSQQSQIPLPSFSTFKNDGLRKESNYVPSNYSNITLYSSFGNKVQPSNIIYSQPMVNIFVPSSGTSNGSPQIIYKTEAISDSSNHISNNTTCSAIRNLILARKAPLPKQTLLKPFEPPRQTSKIEQRNDSKDFTDILDVIKHDLETNFSKTQMQGTTSHVTQDLVDKTKLTTLKDLNNPVVIANVKSGSVYKNSSDWQNCSQTYTSQYHSLVRSMSGSNTPSKARVNSLQTHHQDDKLLKKSAGPVLVVRENDLNNEILNDMLQNPKTSSIGDLPELPDNILKDLNLCNVPDVSSRQNIESPGQIISLPRESVSSSKSSSATPANTNIHSGNFTVSNKINSLKKTPDVRNTNFLRLIRPNTDQNQIMAAKISNYANMFDLQDTPAKNLPFESYGNYVISGKPTSNIRSINDISSSSPNHSSGGKCGKIVSKTVFDVQCKTLNVSANTAESSGKITHTHSDNEMKRKNLDAINKYKDSIIISSEHIKLRLENSKPIVSNTNNLKADSERVDKNQNNSPYKECLVSKSFCDPVRLAFDKSNSIVSAAISKPDLNINETMYKSSTIDSFVVNSREESNDKTDKLNLADNSLTIGESSSVCINNNVNVVLETSSILKDMNVKNNTQNIAENLNLDKPESDSLFESLKTVVLSELQKTNQSKSEGAKVLEITSNSEEQISVFDDGSFNNPVEIKDKHPAKVELELENFTDDKNIEVKITDKFEIKDNEKHDDPKIIKNFVNVKSREPSELGNVNNEVQSVIETRNKAEETISNIFDDKEQKLLDLTEIVQHDVNSVIETRSKSEITITNVFDDKEQKLLDLTEIVEHNVNSVIETSNQLKETISNILDDEVEKLLDLTENIDHHDNILIETSSKLENISDILDAKEEKLLDLTENIEHNDNILIETSSKLENISDILDAKEEKLLDVTENIEHNDNILMETSTKLENISDILDAKEEKLLDLTENVEYNTITETGSKPERQLSNILDSRERKLLDVTENIKHNDNILKETNSKPEEKTSILDDKLEKLLDLTENIEHNDNILIEKSSVLEQDLNNKSVTETSSKPEDSISNILDDKGEKLLELTEDIEDNENIFIEPSSKLEETISDILNDREQNLLDLTENIEHNDIIPIEKSSVLEQISDILDAKEEKLLDLTENIQHKDDSIIEKIGKPEEPISNILDGRELKLLDLTENREPNDNILIESSSKPKETKTDILNDKEQKLLDMTENVENNDSYGMETSKKPEKTISDDKNYKLIDLTETIEPGEDKSTDLKRINDKVNSVIQTRNKSQDDATKQPHKYVLKSTQTQGLASKQNCLQVLPSSNPTAKAVLKIPSIKICGVTKLQNKLENDKQSNFKKRFSSKSFKLAIQKIGGLVKESSNQLKKLRKRVKDEIIDLISSDEEENLKKLPSKPQIESFKIVKPLPPSLSFIELIDIPSKLNKIPIKRNRKTKKKKEKGDPYMVLVDGIGVTKVPSIPKADLEKLKLNCTVKISANDLSAYELISKENENLTPAGRLKSQKRKSHDIESTLQDIQNLSFEYESKIGTSAEPQMKKKTCAPAEPPTKKKCGVVKKTQNKIPSVRQKADVNRNTHKMKLDLRSTKQDCDDVIVLSEDSEKEEVFSEKESGEKITGGELSNIADQQTSTFVSKQNTNIKNSEPEKCIEIDDDLDNNERLSKLTEEELKDVKSVPNIPDSNDDPTNLLTTIKLELDDSNDQNNTSISTKDNSIASSKGNKPSENTSTSVVSEVNLEQSNSEKPNDNAYNKNLHKNAVWSESVDAKIRIVSTKIPIVLLEKLVIPLKANITNFDPNIDMSAKSNLSNADTDADLSTNVTLKETNVEPEDKLDVTALNTCDNHSQNNQPMNLENDGSFNKSDENFLNSSLSLPSLLEFENIGTICDTENRLDKDKKLCKLRNSKSDECLKDVDIDANIFNDKRDTNQPDTTIQDDEHKISQLENVKETNSVGEEINRENISNDVDIEFNQTDISKDLEKVTNPNDFSKDITNETNEIDISKHVAVGTNQTNITKEEEKITIQIDFSNNLDIAIDYVSTSKDTDKEIYQDTISKDVDEETNEVHMSKHGDKETNQFDMLNNEAKETDKSILLNIGDETNQIDISNVLDSEKHKDNISKDLNEERSKANVSNTVDKETNQSDISKDNEKHKTNISKDLSDETAKVNVPNIVDQETNHNDISKDNEDNVSKDSNEATAKANLLSNLDIETDQINVTEDNEKHEDNISKDLSEETAEVNVPNIVDIETYQVSKDIDIEKYEDIISTDGNEETANVNILNISDRDTNQIDISKDNEKHEDTISKDLSEETAEVNVPNIIDIKTNQINISKDIDIEKYEGNISTDGNEETANVNILNISDRDTNQIDISKDNEKHKDNISKDLSEETAEVNVPNIIDIKTNQINISKDIDIEKYEGNISTDGNEETANVNILNISDRDTNQIDISKDNEKHEDTISKDLSGETAEVNVPNIIDIKTNQINISKDIDIEKYEGNISTDGNEETANVNILNISDRDTNQIDISKDNEKHEDTISKDLSEETAEVNVPNIIDIKTNQINISKDIDIEKYEGNISTDGNEETANVNILNISDRDTNPIDISKDNEKHEDTISKDLSEETAEVNVPNIIDIKTNQINISKDIDIEKYEGNISTDGNEETANVNILNISDRDTNPIDISKDNEKHEDTISKDLSEETAEVNVPNIIDIKTNQINISKDIDIEKYEGNISTDGNEETANVNIINISDRDTNQFDMSIDVDNGTNHVNTLKDIIPLSYESLPICAPARDTKNNDKVIPHSITNFDEFETLMNTKIFPLGASDADECLEHMTNYENYLKEEDLDETCFDFSAVLKLTKRNYSKKKTYYRKRKTCLIEYPEDHPNVLKINLSKPVSKQKITLTDSPRFNFFTVKQMVNIEYQNLNSTDLLSENTEIVQIENVNDDSKGNIALSELNAHEAEHISDDIRGSLYSPIFTEDYDAYNKAMVEDEFIVNNLDIEESKMRHIKMRSKKRQKVRLSKYDREGFGFRSDRVDSSDLLDGRHEGPAALSDSPYPRLPKTLDNVNINCRSQGENRENHNDSLQELKELVILQADFENHYNNTILAKANNIGRNNLALTIKGYLEKEMKKWMKKKRKFTSKHSKKDDGIEREYVRKILSNVPGMNDFNHISVCAPSVAVNVVQVSQLPVSSAQQSPLPDTPTRSNSTNEFIQAANNSEYRANSNDEQSSNLITKEVNNEESVMVEQNRNQNNHDNAEGPTAVTTSNNEIPKSANENIKVEININENQQQSTSQDASEQETITLNSVTTSMSNSIPASTTSVDGQVQLIFTPQSTIPQNFGSLDSQEHKGVDTCTGNMENNVLNSVSRSTAPTVGTATFNASSRAQTLVNILSQKISRPPVSTSQVQMATFPKGTPINALSLQQALAQILPPPLSQSSGDGSQNVGHTGPQVVHIVQGKSSGQPGSSFSGLLMENSQQAVVSVSGGTQVLHIVQGKNTMAGNNATVLGQSQLSGTSFGGLSLVDAGSQQGGNQVLHIVNTGQNKGNTPQLLKRVNLLTSLTNSQGNEQKMVQFVCKSSDGKSIQLNAQQRGMVLRLQPIDTSGSVNQQKPVEPLVTTANSIIQQVPKKSPTEQSQEIKSRSIYEENYAKFIQNSKLSPIATEKSSVSLPKFNQAFGKSIYQDTVTKNDSDASQSPTVGNEQSPELTNTIGLTQMGQLSSPPLLIRKTQPSVTTQNIIGQVKQGVTPMNIQTMHGGVIYTRQIPVNIGGGQTINLITVPSSELLDEAHIQAIHKQVQDKNNSEHTNTQQGEQQVIKLVPQQEQNQQNVTLHVDTSSDDANQSFADQQSSTSINTHPLLAQMRIKVPMLSKGGTQMVTGTRVVRPVLQIQRNIIPGTNPQVYQQLVLTTAPALRTPTPTPQPAVRPPRPPTATPQQESNLSTSTLEQLREFDMVFEQVKERSTVQPGSNSNSTFSDSSPRHNTIDPEVVQTSQANVTPQREVLYSIGPNHTVNVTYVNKNVLSGNPTVLTASYPQNHEATAIVNMGQQNSPQIQIGHNLSNSMNPKPTTPTKVNSKSMKPKSSKPPSMAPSSSKSSPVAPKTSVQKPLEDEQTTQRILYILAEYKEQVENSPDKDKPAPRRRSNPPTNPSTSSKRKKGSGSSSKKGPNGQSLQEMSPLGDDAGHTMGSEDSSCGLSQGECAENSIQGPESQSPQGSPQKAARKLVFPHDQEVSNPPVTTQPQRNVIIADGQTIAMTRPGPGGKATAVLMPANYILPMSMVKGGQQITIVTNQGPKILNVPQGEGGATNTVFLQRLISPAGLKPMLARPGQVRQVRLPASAVQNLQTFNLAAAQSLSSNQEGTWISGQQINSQQPKLLVEYNPNTNTDLNPDSVKSEASDAQSLKEESMSISGGSEVATPRHSEASSDDLSSKNRSSDEGIFSGQTDSATEDSIQNSSNNRTDQIIHHVQVTKAPTNATVNLIQVHSLNPNEPGKIYSVQNPASLGSLIRIAGKTSIGQTFQTINVQNVSSQDLTKVSPDVQECAQNLLLVRKNFEGPYTLTTASTTDSTLRDVEMKNTNLNQLQQDLQVEAIPSSGSQRNFGMGSTDQLDDGLAKVDRDGTVSWSLSSNSGRSIVHSGGESASPGYVYSADSPSGLVHQSEQADVSLREADHERRVLRHEYSPDGGSPAPSTPRHLYHKMFISSPDKTDHQIVQDHLKKDDHSQSSSITLHSSNSPSFTMHLHPSGHHLTPGGPSSGGSSSSNNHHSVGGSSGHHSSGHHHSVRLGGDLRTPQHVLRHKYALMEHELRLQKSLSEECEDLGVDSPSASDLFPEADLLFTNSPSSQFDHSQDGQMSSAVSNNNIATNSSANVSGANGGSSLSATHSGASGTVGGATLGLGRDDNPVDEEFARMHPNTTFHSSEIDILEDQDELMFRGASKRCIRTVPGRRNEVVRSVIEGVGSSGMPSLYQTNKMQTHFSLVNLPKRNSMNIMSLQSSDDNSEGAEDSLNSAESKDDLVNNKHLDGMLNTSITRDLNLSVSDSPGCISSRIIQRNVTQVIRHANDEQLLSEKDSVKLGCDENSSGPQNGRSFLLENSGDVRQGDSMILKNLMMERDGRDGLTCSSPEQHSELFWESNSNSNQSDEPMTHGGTNLLDFSSEDSNKCCKSPPSCEETNSTDSSSIGGMNLNSGKPLRLNSVIKSSSSTSTAADGPILHSALTSNLPVASQESRKLDLNLHKSDSNTSTSPDGESMEASSRRSWGRSLKNSGVRRVLSPRSLSTEINMGAEIETSSSEGVNILTKSGGAIIHSGSSTPEDSAIVGRRVSLRGSNHAKRSCHCCPPPSPPPHSNNTSSSLASQILSSTSVNNATAGGPNVGSVATPMRGRNRRKPQPPAQ